MFCIHIGADSVAKVPNYKTAQEVFKRACLMAEVMGKVAYLVNCDTGEVIANTEKG